MGKKLNFLLKKEEKFLSKKKFLILF